MARTGAGGSDHVEKEVWQAVAGAASVSATAMAATAAAAAAGVRPPRPAATAGAEAAPAPAPSATSSTASAPSPAPPAAGDGDASGAQTQSAGGLQVELQHTAYHSSVVCCVRISDDAKLLATGSLTSVQLFDVTSGALIARLACAPDYSEAAAAAAAAAGDGAPPPPPVYVRAVCFTPDSRFVVAAAAGNTLIVWDLETLAPT